MPLERKEKCPDCDQCQMCAESRCRKCRSGLHTKGPSELGSAFTHGEYMAWKKKKQDEKEKQTPCGQGCNMKKGRTPANRVPVIDLSRCTDCGSCLEVCASVFKRNKETGLIEVIDLPHYPEGDLQEAVAMCPTDCITLEDE